MEKVFLARVKRTKATGVIDKGLEVRNDMDDAKQGFHAYMAAYAYGHDQTVDYAQCLVFNSQNQTLLSETWEAPAEPEPAVEEEN